MNDVHFSLLIHPIFWIFDVIFVDFVREKMINGYFRCYPQRPSLIVSKHFLCRGPLSNGFLQTPFYHGRAFYIFLIISLLPFCKYEILVKNDGKIIVLIKYNHVIDAEFLWLVFVTCVFYVYGLRLVRSKFCILYALHYSL